MAMKLISVDCGKSDTKICSYDVATKEIKKDIIPTKVTKASALLEVAMQEHEYKVCISQKDLSSDVKGEWIVGTINGDTSYSNSKKDMIHKIMTLTAIALMTDNGDTVILSIGCPLTVFDNNGEKKAYFDYIVPDGRVDVTINGQNRFYYVQKDKCMVFPESFGAVFTCKEALKGNVGVVDIGGLNINASFFSNGRLDKDLCRTEKLGYYALIRSLKSNINAMCDSNFNDTQIRVFLDQRSVTNHEESKEIIEASLDEHFRRIEKSLQDWDLDNITIIFIGGTTYLLKKQIDDRFNRKAIIPKEANFVNAKGFLKAMINGMGYKCPEAF